MTRVAAVLALTATVASAWGQGNPAKAPVARRAIHKLAGDAVEMKTAEGWTLSGIYSPAKDGGLVFILLHEAGGRKENWFALCKTLAKEGIGYLAFDLRGHGASQNAPPGQDGRWPKFRVSKQYNEWENMDHDVEAAAAFLTSRGVKDGSIGLGGADVGANIALRYAAIHKDVAMVFLLSPSSNYREVRSVNPIRRYGKRPLLMIVGGDDNRSMTDTGILFQFARTAAGPENVGMWVLDREHGTKIFTANQGIVERVVEWMRNPQQAILAPQPSTASPTQLLPGDDGQLIH